VQSRQAFATVPINPFSNGPRADAYGLARRLPALDLQYNPLSTARRQPGILMHVHPVLRWNLKLQQPQLPRSEPDGQPTESSQLATYASSGANAFCRPPWVGRRLRREPGPKPKGTLIAAPLLWAIHIGCTKNDRS
jgi:hypothetical protein